MKGKISLSAELTSRREFPINLIMRLSTMEITGSKFFMWVKMRTKNLTKLLIKIILKVALWWQQEVMIEDQEGVSKSLKVVI